MSNVRCLKTEVHARKVGTQLERRGQLALCCERWQEAVQEARGCSRRAKLQRTNCCLGRPSVGGRLTAGAARQEEQGSSRPSSKAPDRKGARAVPFGHALACKLDALCLRGSSLAGSRPVEQTRAVNTVPSFQSAKSMRGLLSAHVVTLVRGQRRHLTPPSSGRSKGRFSPFGPPLMSNVRSVNPMRRSFALWLAGLIALSGGAAYTAEPAPVPATFEIRRATTDASAIRQFEAGQSEGGWTALLRTPDGDRWLVAPEPLVETKHLTEVSVVAAEPGRLGSTTHLLQMSLNAEGTERLALATRLLLDRQVAFLINGALVGGVVVRSVVSAGRFQVHIQGASPERLETLAGELLRARI